MAKDIGFDLSTSLDGTPKKITRANADIFLKAYGERLEVYRQAIVQRGYPSLVGRYRLEASSSCKGEKLDLREIFSSSGDDDKPMMYDALDIRQSDFKVELVMPGLPGGEPNEVVFPGVALERSVVFRATNLNFYFLGSVHQRTISLRADIPGMQAALGEWIATAADWKQFAKCAFVLSQK
jgi:hypothetical protein